MKTALHRLLDFLESSRRSLFVPAVLLLSALVHTGASAQEQTVYKRGATQLENLLPPAPEAASAVKYVDVPFSHSEGLARLDIPIHTLKGRELSIPISLRYTSGGIKMDEIAGVAGLGWTLEAGGCVTRTVADMPDEFSAAGFGHRMPGSGLLSKLEDPADNSTDKMSYLRDIVWHRLDASLDRYSYSVCGLTGSFVITDDGDVFHLSGDGTAVSYARDSTGAMTLESAACSGGRLTPAGALLHVTDNLGSVRAVVRGSDGAFLAARDFGVYGEESCTPVPESARAAIPQSLTLRDGFTGQESQIPDFGLPYTDFGARLYSPALRRWLTPDPLAEKYLGVSPYAYCDGNPVSVIDDGGEDLVLVGRGNSSVTLKSDIVNLTVDVSRLGVDWQGNHTLQGDDVLGAALDVAGIFDPTGAADAANMTLQVSRGDYGDALVSAIGLIPYAGDFAKLTRAGKDIRIISGAVEAVSHSSGLRKNMVKALGKAPDGAQAHHVFPVKFKATFVNEFGIKIDDVENGVWLDSHKHLSGAWKYNMEWKKFFKENPDASKEDVMEFARKNMQNVYNENVNF